MTPAQRHVAKVALAAAAASKAPAAKPQPSRPPSTAANSKAAKLGAVTVLEAANDNAPIAGAEAPSAAALIRVQMAEDRRQLKSQQSIEARIERKRELLPNYTAWVEGVMRAGVEAYDADPTFRLPQDDVVLNVMIWSLDVGDLVAAVAIFNFALVNEWIMPANFKRDLVTFVTEEAADQSVRALDAGRPADLMALSILEEIVRERDMPDEVRARLHKAMGRELVRRTEESAAAGELDTPTRRARLEAALQQLVRARDLDSQSGCKTDIGRLERELKKIAPPSEVETTAGDATETQDAPPSTEEPAT